MGGKVFEIDEKISSIKLEQIVIGVRRGQFKEPALSQESNRKLSLSSAITPFLAIFSIFQLLKDKKIKLKKI